MLPRRVLSAPENSWASYSYTCVRLSSTSDWRRSPSCVPEQQTTILIGACPATNQTTLHNHTLLAVLPRFCKQGRIIIIIIITTTYYGATQPVLSSASQTIQYTQPEIRSYPIWLKIGYTYVASCCKLAAIGEIFTSLNISVKSDQMDHVAVISVSLK